MQQWTVWQLRSVKSALKKCAASKKPKPEMSEKCCMKLRHVAAVAWHFAVAVLCKFSGTAGAHLGLQVFT